MSPRGRRIFLLFLLATLLLLGGGAFQLWRSPLDRARLRWAWLDLQRDAGADFRANQRERRELAEALLDDGSLSLLTLELPTPELHARAQELAEGLRGTAGIWRIRIYTLTEVVDGQPVESVSLQLAIEPAREAQIQAAFERAKARPAKARPAKAGLAKAGLAEPGG